MKKFIKMFLIALAFGLLFNFMDLYCTGASEIVSTGEISGYTKEETEESFGGGIIKKQTIHTYNYTYPKVIKNENKIFNKCKCHVEIKYYHSILNQQIASLDVYANFRYNHSERRAECQSVSFVKTCNDINNYPLIVTKRRANETTEKGAGIADVKLKYKSSVCDEKKYNLSCDWTGKMLCEYLNN